MTSKYLNSTLRNGFGNHSDPDCDSCWCCSASEGITLEFCCQRICQIVPDAASLFVDLQPVSTRIAQQDNGNFPGELSVLKGSCTLPTPGTSSKEKEPTSSLAVLMLKAKPRHNYQFKPVSADEMESDSTLQLIIPLILAELILELPDPVQHDGELGCLGQPRNC